MPVLLDTHVLLWWLADHEALGVQARRRITFDRPWVSPVSFWEIAIKVSIGKLDSDVDQIAEAVEADAMAILEVQRRHYAALQSLPRHHRDPFDRMLIVQSMVEGIPLLTADRVFEHYDVHLLDATR